MGNLEDRLRVRRRVVSNAVNYEARRREDADAHDALLLGGEGAHVVGEGLEAGERGRDALLEVDSRRREFDVAPPSLEQRHAELRLEAADRLRECGLRDVELARAVGHVLALGDFEEVLELEKLH